MEPEKKHVLFICFGNACRSPMAEAIAHKEAGDIIDASSAGLYPLGEIPLHTRKTLEENGYSAEGLASKAIAREAWQRADMVINLSGRMRQLEFEDFEKVEDWDVADPYGEGEVSYQKTFLDLQARVKDLAQRLRNGQAPSGKRN
jgi:protein-tyrosine-phosphatase